MTIDIQPGDTFRIATTGVIWQVRAGQYRACFSSGNMTWFEPAQHYRGNEIPRNKAIEILTLAGHTITETTPPATPVPWPTHAVVDCSGALVAFGTFEQCKAYSGSDTYTVRPLAPAPLSPAMRAFIEVIRTDTYGATTIREAAAALLAEGGAK